MAVRRFQKSSSTAQRRSNGAVCAGSAFKTAPTALMARASPVSHQAPSTIISSINGRESSVSQASKPGAKSTSTAA